MAGSQRQAALAAATKTRVQGVATQQTVKTAAGYLHRILISNGDAAAQSLTVVDGAATLGVYWVPTKDSRMLEFFCQMGTSILITPSSANLDALILFD